LALHPGPVRRDGQRLGQPGLARRDGPLLHAPLGRDPGDPAYDDLEVKLAENPPIQVPTIVLRGADDGATLVAASEGKDQFFTAGYERLVLAGIGHVIPREAPARAAQAILRAAT
jgi:pimeloyl-ACP methyl ester carboxylesterase